MSDIEERKKIIDSGSDIKDIKYMNEKEISTLFIGFLSHLIIYVVVYCLIINPLIYSGLLYTKFLLDGCDPKNNNTKYSIFFDNIELLSNLFSKESFSRSTYKDLKVGITANEIQSRLNNIEKIPPANGIHADFKNSLINEINEANVYKSSSIVQVFTDILQNIDPSNNSMFWYYNFYYNVNITSIKNLKDLLELFKNIIPVKFNILLIVFLYVFYSYSAYFIVSGVFGSVFLISLHALFTNIGNIFKSGNHIPSADDSESPKKKLKCGSFFYNTYNILFFIAFILTFYLSIIFQCVRVLWCLIGILFNISKSGDILYLVDDNTPISFISLASSLFYYNIFIILICTIFVISSMLYLHFSSINGIGILPIISLICIILSYAFFYFTKKN